MLCSDTLRFADLLFENKVRVNAWDKFVQGKTKLVRVSEGFESIEFKLSGVNYYKKHCHFQGKLDLVRVGKELSEFELAGDYCMPYIFMVEILPCLSNQFF